MNLKENEGKQNPIRVDDKFIGKTKHVEYGFVSITIFVLQVLPYLYCKYCCICIIGICICIKLICTINICIFMLQDTCLLFL